MRIINLGYIFALSSAFLWALVSILYKNIGREVSPLGINIGKNTIAVICLGMLLLFQGVNSIDIKPALYLIISGIFGIVLGDSLFFMAINRLKSSVAVLTTTLIPVISVLLAVIFLNEKFSGICWVGIIITIIGIAIVLLESRPGDINGGISLTGVLFGALSALFCAVSIIFSKVALVSVTAIEASFIRHIAGLLILVILGSVSLNIKKWINPLLINKNIMIKLIYASFLGTFLGTLLSLAGLKLAPAAIATVLNSTSPVFILPLAYILLKERFSPLGVAGSIIAFGGVSIIILNS